MTLCWGALVRLFSGHHPTLYSYQNSLPRMPVPALKDTCKRFMLSMKPLLDDKEYDEMQALAEVRKLIALCFIERFSYEWETDRKNYCTVTVKVRQEFRMFL